MLDPFLKEKKQKYPGCIFFIWWVMTEYPRLRYLLRSTALEQTFFDMEKENLLGLSVPVLTEYNKRLSELYLFPSLRICENCSRGILLFLGSMKI